MTYTVHMHMYSSTSTGKVGVPGPSPQARWRLTTPTLARLTYAPKRARDTRAADPMAKPCSGTRLASRQAFQQPCQATWQAFERHRQTYAMAAVG